MDTALSRTHARVYNGLRAIVKQNRTWAGACSGASGRLDRMPGIAVVVAAVPSVRAGCRGLSSEALAERVEADATAPTCPITRSSSPVNRTEIAAKGRSRPRGRTRLRGNSREHLTSRLFLPSFSTVIVSSRLVQSVVGGSTCLLTSCGSRKPDHRGIPRKMRSLGGAR